MANRAKRTNMYNHAYQVKVNKWKKKVLRCLGQIDICQSKIDKYTEIVLNENNPQAAVTSAHNNVMYYRSQKQRFIQELGDLTGNVPHRKIVKNRKAV